MSFVHPLIMVGFFVFLFRQLKLVQEILGLKEKSPDWDRRDDLIARHRQWSYLLLGWAFAGLIGGVVITMYVLQASPAFMRTYGHGSIGTLAFAALLSAFFLGPAIKKVVRPRVRVRFLSFHLNMVYIVFGLGIFSLATGLAVLILGPSALN